MGEPDLVEAVIQHVYTGELPECDVLHVLQLAHRLELKDCVSACAAAVDNYDVVDVLRVLAPLLGEPDLDAAWARTKRRIHSDESLFESVIHAAAESRPSKRQRVSLL